MKSSRHSLLSRGFIKEFEVIINHEISIDLLRGQLFSKEPVERTKASIIIKQMKI